MERRLQTRRDELRRDAQVPPGLLRGVVTRLDTFPRPVLASRARDETRANAGRYAPGPLPNVEGKTAEGIADLHDRDRQGLQTFVGSSPWDHRPRLAELARQVGAASGGPDGVRVFDPSAFPKEGSASVGVARPWCGRRGQVENGQVGVDLADVARSDHALVDTRLYPPREWTRERRRMPRAGVPPGTRFRTRHELTLDMPAEHGPAPPHGWVAGDAEIGRCWWFRGEVRGRGERYLLAVPSNTAVRDRAAEPPPYRGPGRRPTVPFVRADRWAAGAARGGVGGGRRPTGRDGAADGRGRPRGGPGPDRAAAGRRGRGAGGGPGAATGRVVEVRLPAFERPAGHPGGRVRPGRRRRAPGGGRPRAGEGGGRAGRRPGAALVRVAPPPGPVAGRHVVPDAGRPAGEETGPRP